MGRMRDPATAVAQMRENCKLKLPWFIGHPVTDRELIPVCGGPSLRNQVRQIRARKDAGGVIIACNGAGKFLADRGIIPQFVAYVDPSIAVCGMIDQRMVDSPRYPIYFVASICHPAVFELLSGSNVCVWHPDICEEEQKAILDEYPDNPSVLIGGGNTIGLRMLNIGYLLGFRKFHFYGLDGSFAEDGADHAYKKHDGPEDAPVRTALLNGRTYRGSSWMIQQSGEFLEDQYPQFVNMGCKIWVHGRGLIPDMCKELHRRERLAA